MMKCPNEDCLGAIRNPQMPCPVCGHVCNDSQREQFDAIQNNIHVRPVINRTRMAIEWGGCDYPNDL